MQKKKKKKSCKSCRWVDSEVAELGRQLQEKERWCFPSATDQRRTGMGTMEERAPLHRCLSHWALEVYTIPRTSCILSLLCTALLLCGAGRGITIRLCIWQGIYMRPSERHLRAPPRCSYCAPIVKANEAHLFPAGITSDLTTPHASNPSLANLTQCHRRMTNELRNRPQVTHPAKNSRSLCWNVLKMHREYSWPVKCRETNSSEPNMEYVTF